MYRAGHPAPPTLELMLKSMTIVLPFIFITLLIPYLLWGIYILRLQFTYREELEAKMKWSTISGVLAFFFIELFVLRKWIGADSTTYLFTTMGLMLSTAALYGHLAVSIASQMVVDFIHPPDDHESHTPDFAPAEALEEIGDYNGALQEYLVIGRIFPKDPDPLLRLADTYMHIDDPENAVIYYEKGVALVLESERALRITNRLFGIYTTTLEQDEAAKEALHQFLKRFPDSEECASAQRRLNQLDKPKKKENEVFQSVTGMLEAPPNDLLG